MVRRIRKKQLMMVISVMILSSLACGLGKAEPTATATPPPTKPPADTPVPSPTSPPPATSTPSHAPGFEQAQSYAGKWEGSWRNTTFGSTGAIEVETAASPDGTATVTINIGGMVFGAIDPDPNTYSGTYDADGATFEVMDDPVFGQVVVMISFTDGVITSSGDSIPNPSIASMETTGTISADELNATYTIFFAGGGQAQGEVTLTRVVE